MSLRRRLYFHFSYSYFCATRTQRALIHSEFLTRRTGHTMLRWLSCNFIPNWTIYFNIFFADVINSIGENLRRPRIPWTLKVERGTKTIVRYLLFHLKNFLPRFLCAIVIVLIDIDDENGGRWFSIHSTFDMKINVPRQFLYRTPTHGRNCNSRFHRINKFSLLFTQQQQQSIFVINWISGAPSSHDIHPKCSPEQCGYFLFFLVSRRRRRRIISPSQFQH